MIARILLILPIINFVFALPIAVQETRQVCGDAAPDVAITISAKRGDEMEKQLDIYFESLSGKPESSSPAHRRPGSARSESDHEPINGHALSQSPASSAAPDYGSMDLRRVVTSENQQVSPELLNSPSLDHYVRLPEVSPAPELSNSPSWTIMWGRQKCRRCQRCPAPLDVVSTSDSGPSRSAAVRVIGLEGLAANGKAQVQSFLYKVVSKLSKLKFWRRISGPGTVREAVNAARRELQGLVDTGAYVSASSPSSRAIYG